MTRDLSWRQPELALNDPASCLRIRPRRHAAGWATTTARRPPSAHSNTHSSSRALEATLAGSPTTGAVEPAEPTERATDRVLALRLRYSRRITVTTRPSTTALSPGIGS